MVEDHNKVNKVVGDLQSTEEWLSYAYELVPVALQKAREVKGFPGRWKMIISKLEQIPTRLSDLSSHPCFSKNMLCIEQLQAVAKTLNESLEMAEKCSKEKYEGKLQMQSDLDALSGKIDLNLRDCGLLIKTGVLGEVSLSSCTSSGSEGTSSEGCNVTELLARLQIGHLEAKHKALDCLADVMREDEKMVSPFLGRSSISALVQLLTATSPRIREKTVTLICTLAESGTCENLLVSEGVLPPLIRLLESGSSVGREKSAITLQQLSRSAEIASSIVGHGGVQPLMEVCYAGDSVSQASATCTLKNLSVVPDLRQALAEEGVVKIMIDILDSGILFVSKEYAAECLQNLTLSNEFKMSVITEGGVRSLLSYLDSGLPQEPAIGTIRNLVGSVSVETLVSLGLLPRLVRILNSSSNGSLKLAAATICRITDSPEMKKLVGESGCMSLLIKLLEVKQNDVREAATQALASLMTLACNAREVKHDMRSVPSLVQLLDPSPQNTAKKYAVACLVILSTSKKCRKLMISYGAIGYLKKLTEMDIIESKKLLERLQRGKFINLFGKN
nr:protein CELLULOSE SYNTHASE INTERACTIVE 1-like isoform X2 [Erigeron canadensis]XP_043628542.1 protein CELLULOSE SYNTHASE INTERACTIVE 1-like isoform X2 [Erigeron canadensis]XP_043628543.1 protein CELLULOSE SYNTHASE INTERACTIVE 1-like isoform X2 [Erigeron canadensis]XP_043628544.1 protein CELLULOSE SYNTHASE INTERACTIVE 1-like isoform X2 [Erigeron canadensis]